MTFPFLRAALAAVLALLMACGGGDPARPVSSSITLSLSAPAATVAAGASNVVTATLSRSNFEGDVTLASEGAPSGVQVSFAPATLSGSVSSSTVTLQPAQAVAAGVYPITIRASGSGVTAATSILSLTVTPSGSFALSLVPATLTITRGNTASSTVTVARSGTFSGPVTFSVTGAPQGMHVAVLPGTVATAPATVSVATSAATPLGMHVLTIRGTGPDVADQSVPLSVSVVSAPAGTQVVFHQCGVAPLWMGYRNGTDPWTAADLTGVAAYTAYITAEYGTIAIVRGSSSAGYETHVIQAATTELVGISQASYNRCQAAGPGSRAVTGTIAGVVAGTRGEVTFGRSSTTVPAPATQYSIADVPQAPRDLGALRRDLASGLPNAIVLRRMTDVGAGGSLALVDFNGAEAVAPATATLTPQGWMEGERQFAFSHFTSNAGMRMALSNVSIAAADFASGIVSGVPGSLVVSSDMHHYGVTAVREDNSATRSVEAHGQQVFARTLAYGPNFAAVTLTTLSAAAPVQLRAQWTVQAEYAKVQRATFEQERPASGPTGPLWRRVVIEMGQGPWAGGVLQVPDFGTAAGYRPEWGLRAGVAVEWTASGTSATFQQLAAPTEGLIVRHGSRRSTTPVSPSLR